jgi:hypothetical protein
MSNDLISPNAKHRYMRLSRLEGEVPHSSFGCKLNRSGVEVKFETKPPGKEMKLVIAVSEQAPVQHKIAKAGEVKWNGNM